MNTTEFTEILKKLARQTIFSRSICQMVTDADPSHMSGNPWVGIYIIKHVWGHSFAVLELPLNIFIFQIQFLKKTCTLLYAVSILLFFIIWTKYYLMTMC